MNTAKNQHDWTAILNLFGEQNRMRPTRLGVFERGREAAVDYWLEDGLPLAGVTVDARGAGEPAIAIMLGGDARDERRMTHTVEKARAARIVLSAAGDDDGLEIDGADGKTTFLRFEK